MDKTFIFGTTERNISGRDVTEFIFPYRIEDTSSVRHQGETPLPYDHSIKVAVTRTLSSIWDFTDDQLHRIMFEYGKRHVIQKLRDGTLREFEELVLHTANAERPCPFDPAQIENPIGAIVKVESAPKKLMEDKSLLQLASAIIDARDNINAIFHQEHNEKLIILNEERNLLQFFRDAESEEEFFFRLSALRNAVTNLNVKCLRRLTEITDTQVKSIQLLEAYLDKHNIPKQTIIDTFRKINKMRQGYPVHGDRLEGVIEAHKFFSFDYPIEEYSAAWKKLLFNYLEALKQLLESLKK